MTPPTNPRVAKIVEDGLFAAFESGWFDNTGDIGDGWSEVKDDLIVEMKAKLLALLEDGERVARLTEGLEYIVRRGYTGAEFVARTTLYTTDPIGSPWEEDQRTPTEEGHDE